MRIFLMAVVASAALAVCSSASAGDYLATYTGVVSNSYALAGNGDTYVNTDDFGAIDGAFDGATFTVTFRYDTGVGNEAAYPWTKNLTGLAPNSPISRAAITINGRTAALGPIAHSLVTAFNFTSAPPSFPDARGFGHQAESYSDDGLNINSVGLFLYNVTVEAELDQLFSGAPSGGDAQYSTGSFALQSYDARTDTYRFSGGDLRPTYLTIAAAPEPEAWALMLMGFAGLGAALRLQRRALRRTSDLRH